MFGLLGFSPMGAPPLFDDIMMTLPLYLRFTDYGRLAYFHLKRYNYLRQIYRLNNEMGGGLSLA